MNKKIGILCSLLLLVLCGCRNDLDTLSGGATAEGIPVLFTAECPKDGFPNTRAGAMADKETFTKNDVIHVTAKFYSSEDAAGEPLSIQYTTLTLNADNEWVNTNKILTMTWPWRSKCAVFEAYYLADWDGPLGGDASIANDIPAEPVLLDRFTSGTTIFNPDPLRAKTGVVEYGHAVHLEFEHCCARLTIVGVGDEDEYWLKYKDNGSELKTLKNACRLTRKTDNTLDFQFIAEESGKGKVAASTYETATGKQKAVTFHLAPDNYETFSLTRRNGYGYITISNVTGLKQLEANTSYEVSIEELMGNITQDGDDDDWWDGEVDPMPESTDFSVQAFMNAIAKSEKYKCQLEEETVVLLERDPYRSEVRLTRDVDFKGGTFIPVTLPDLARFDGGGHTISGVAHPLFADLKGTVTRLNIADAEVNAGTADEPYDDGDWGILARRCSGTVTDMHVKGAKLNVVISGESDQVHNIGLLAGLAGGKLSGITFDGDLSVTVSSGYAQNALYVTNVGGVIGQCSGVLDDFNCAAAITVQNSCVGYSSRYTGGIAGLVADGTISNSMVNANVDVSKAIGTWNYVGGVTGGVRADADRTAAINNVMVGGSVTGGRVYAVPNTDKNHSSTGGIVGHVQNASVTWCTSTAGVSINANYAPSEPNASEYYSIGGCIGSIVTTKDIKNNTGLFSFNTGNYSHSGDYYHAGTFAGVVDAGGAKLDENTNSANGTGKFVGIYNE